MNKKDKQFIHKMILWFPLNISTSLYLVINVYNFRHLSNIEPYFDVITSDYLFSLKEQRINKFNPFSRGLATFESRYLYFLLFYYYNTLFLTRYKNKICIINRSRIRFF